MSDELGFDPKNSGWIPPEDRTPEMTKAHNDIMDSMPVLACSGPAFERPKWSVAWAYQDEVAGIDQWRRNGHIKNVRQLTGSCVGTAVTQVGLYSSITDAIYFADPTRVLFPFTGYHYGLGRLESGARGRGEGSGGAGQARALEKYGFVSFDHPGVPAPTMGDVIQWTSQVEMDWSDGARLPQALIPEGSKYKFQAVTRCTSVEQAIDLMASRYWGTQASNWGGISGRGVVKGDGNNQVLMMPRRESWSHQMGIFGYWIHPTLGVLIAIGNQWAYLHGDDPQRVEDENTPPPAPPGFFWVIEKDFENMLSYKEVFFYGGMPNFEVRPGKYRMG